MYANYQREMIEEFNVWWMFAVERRKWKSGKIHNNARKTSVKEILTCLWQRNKFLLLNKASQKLEMVEGNPNNLIPWCGKCTENKFSQFHVHHYNIILFSFRIVLWVRRGKIIDSKMKGRRIWSCRELQKGKFDLYR